MTNGPELQVGGMDLRHLLTTFIWDLDRPITVDQLVRTLDERRITVKGRASKTISDALRWEVGKGRLIRVRRSTYAPGRMPRSTRWWLRERVYQIVAPTLADRALCSPWLPVMSEPPRGPMRTSTRTRGATGS